MTHEHVGDQGRGRVLLEVLAGSGASHARLVLDDTSALHIPGSSGLAGEYQGREAIVGLAEHMVELTSGTLKFCDRFCVQVEDGTIRLRGRSTATRRGRQLDTELELVVLLGPVSVRAMWLNHPDQSHVDEFWS